LRAQRPDLLVATDEEGGDVTRLDRRDGSPYPGHLVLGRAGDPALTEAVARDIGVRLAAAGINLDLAPVADVNTNPDNPVIGVRSFGADPHAVAAHVRGYVTGLQSAGVAACAKHFPGHGDTAVDSHLAVPVVSASREQLAEQALPPFRAAIEAGSRCVMTAHLMVTGYDERRPATMSPVLLTGLLRGELGFDGVIVSDGLDMAGAGGDGPGGLADAAVRSVAAGADLLCVGGGPADRRTVLLLRDALVRAVHTGELPAGRLAEAADRVARLARQVPLPAGRPAAPGPGTAHVPIARAAVTADGVPPLAGPPVLLELAAPANIAVGEVTWGLAADLAAALPGTVVLPHDTSAAAAVDSAGAAPIVVVCRDLHRYPGHRRTVTAIRAARPDAVLVELGWPGPAWPAPYLVTGGAGRASTRAAVEVLIAGGAR
jgi:beta-N-acetylhexosaminidase